MHTKGEFKDIMSQWREQAKKEGRITIWGNAEHIKRDWVWVGDVCRLHIDFIKQVNGSGIWNVGSGLSHSYFDIAEEISIQEGVELKLIDPKITEQYNTKADLRHLKETIGKRKWANVYEWLDRGIE
jgi:nucleoside-diphosphate-sugar epimerase